MQGKVEFFVSMPTVTHSVIVPPASALPASPLLSAGA